MPLTAHTYDVAAGLLVNWNVAVVAVVGFVGCWVTVITGPPPPPPPPPPLPSAPTATALMLFPALVKRPLMLPFRNVRLAIAPSETIAMISAYSTRP